MTEGHKSSRSRADPEARVSDLSDRDEHLLAYLLLCNENRHRRVQSRAKND